MCVCVTMCIIIDAIGCGNNETLKQHESQEKKEKIAFFKYPT